MKKLLLAAALALSFGTTVAATGAYDLQHTIDMYTVQQNPGRDWTLQPVQYRSIQPQPSDTETCYLQCTSSLQK